MKMKVIFKWYDIWVGFFIDRKKRRLYFFPIPMVGFVFTLKERNGKIVEEPLLMSELVKRNTVTSEELRKAVNDIGYTSTGF